ncbi:MAG: YiiX/YebB-like N1pC/P60 family cysteine hydrolase [Tepidibacillus sp.]
MKKVTAVFVLMLMMVFGSFGNVFAAEKGIPELDLTQKQLAEIKQGKMQTELIKKQWETRKGSKYYGDLKVSEDVSIQAGYYSRPGMFLVTLDTASSSSSAWAGGHAGLVYNDYFAIESFGNKGDKNGVNLWPNDWDTRYEHMELRSTNDTTIDEDKQAAEKAYLYIGKPYNYNFFYIDQDDSFYCSQLVWYVFNDLFNINLNDGGAVWPVDLTESSEAYLVYSK